jgi:hypothetical protein
MVHYKGYFSPDKLIIQHDHTMAYAKGAIVPSFGGHFIFLLLS